MRPRGATTTGAGRYTTGGRTTTTGAGRTTTALRTQPP